ncbi:MAG: 3-dehydroquinate dehydratase [Ilumatobacteraceae bacterium]|jgi:3-dehydroquinate dehydratase-2|nr:3-dehydroquinate dehydratase [Ilumatobacteraceae bacterium]
MSLSSILVLHGPNLNLLGTREPEIYGSATLSDHVNTVKAEASSHGIAVADLQSASESELVSAIHQAKGTHDAIIINAGALTHYSWSLHDALRSFPGKVIEVHLSNPGAREDFRHVSVLAPVVDGSISGFGGMGYALAVQALLRLS